MPKIRTSRYKLGERFTVTIPTDVDVRVLKWINLQNKLSPATIKAISQYVLYPQETPTDLKVAFNKLSETENWKYSAGGRYTVRIPLDLDLKVLGWINSQKYLSPAIIKVMEDIIDRLYPSKESTDKISGD